MRLEMRRVFALLVLVCPVVVSAAEEPKKVVASVESSLATEGKQIRQLAFDADPETYFESKEAPKATDQFTLTFDPPVVLKSVKVVTGKPDGADKLDAGSVQISTNGKEFEDVATFKEGHAHHKGGEKAVQAIRIKPASDLTHHLVIREIEVEAAEPVATFRYPIEFTVDVTDAPEMKEWADKVARLCEAWYPRLNEELKSEGYKPATQITMTLKSSYNGVAAAGGTRITGSVKFFKEHPNDLGAMIHETCHIIQRYQGRRNRNPGWLVEGVADYVRFFVYEPGKAGPVNRRRAHYNDSYRTTAAFLAYVSGKYDKELVLKLNKLMREGNYKEDVFKELTGKTPQELDEEWLASLAK
jgi:Peptidase of plants and bacteria